MLYGGLGIVAANLLLVVALFWRSTRRMEQSAAPLMEGIGKIAAGQPAALPETGELAPVQKALNRVSAQMARRDAARAEWINGISHDVRTPLSVILGYAGTLAADPALSPAARQQAGMICAQGERLRDLIRDLNLVSQLEYSMQPLQWRHLDPVELARGVLSELLNGGLDSRYALELQTAGREDTIEGDPALLARALENLVRNSIRHNPGGCTVTVTVDREPETCRFTVQDDGVGMTAAAMERANAGQFEAAQNGSQHGFGLRLVYGIAAAHGGDHGLPPGPAHRAGSDDHPPGGQGAGRHGSGVKLHRRLCGTKQSAGRQKTLPSGAFGLICLYGAAHRRLSSFSTAVRSPVSSSRAPSP